MWLDVPYCQANKQHKRDHKIHFALKQNKRASRVEFASKKDRRVHKLRFVFKQDKRARRAQVALKQDRRVHNLRFVCKKANGIVGLNFF